MSRESKLYFEDMLTAIEKIEKYTKEMEFPEFEKNGLVVDAVIRNLLVIGEAAKNLPPESKKKTSEVDWKRYPD